MTEESTSPLDRRLLAALRTDSPVPSEVRGRVRDRLEASIPGMAPRAGTRDGGPGGASSGGSAGRGFGAGLHTVAVAAFLAGGVTGAALYSVMSQTPAPRVVYVDRAAPQSVAPTTAAPPRIKETRVTENAMNARPLPAALPVPAISSPPSIAAQPATPLSAPATHVSRFAEERLLLDEARAGLLAGEPELALARLDAHRARFADGLLSEERDAMQVEALVRAGRPDEARARANAFRERSPGSLFLPTVESAIASIP